MTSDISCKENEKILRDLMFRNTPIIDNPSITIKCRKCYTHWLDCYNITKFNNKGVLYNNMNTEKQVIKQVKELLSDVDYPSGVANTLAVDDIVLEIFDKLDELNKFIIEV